MGVEQGQLLAAVNGGVGIVDIEDDAFANALEAGAKQIDHDQPHARQLAPRQRVFEARQGRVGSSDQRRSRTSAHRPA